MLAWITNFCLSVILSAAIKYFGQIDVNGSLSFHTYYDKGLRVLRSRQKNRPI